LPNTSFAALAPWYTAAKTADTPPEGGNEMFDLASPGFLADPYPRFHQLRSATPMHLASPGVWVASRYADVHFVMSDPRFGKCYETRLVNQFGRAILEEPAYRTIRRWMLVQDPPAHTALRRPLAKAFAARSVAAMRASIQELVDRLIDRVLPLGEMDVMRDFAHPLPAAVICRMLGIADGDQPAFLQQLDSIGRLLDPAPMSAAELAEANRMDGEMQAYFAALIALRRREPADDMITHMVQAKDTGDAIDDLDLIANIMLLFGAGHETVYGMIGNSLLALQRHPDQLARLRNDPGLLPAAVNELLRYDSSSQVTTRTAIEAVTVSGTLVQAGETVIALLGAANRDPATFEHPDRVDFARPDLKPLSFGGGLHYCLGAQLARHELEIALGTLLRRIPDLRLEGGDADADWRPTLTLRGLRSLRATWAPAG
jgi:cytochrome P450